MADFEACDVASRVIAHDALPLCRDIMHTRQAFAAAYSTEALVHVLSEHITPAIIQKLRGAIDQISPSALSDVYAYIIASNAIDIDNVRQMLAAVIAEGADMLISNADFPPNPMVYAAANEKARSIVAMGSRQLLQLPDELGDNFILAPIENLIALVVPLVTPDRTYDRPQHRTGAVEKFGTALKSAIQEVSVTYAGPDRYTSLIDYIALFEPVIIAAIPWMLAARFVPMIGQDLSNVRRQLGLILESIADVYMAAVQLIDLAELDDDGAHVVRPVVRVKNGQAYSELVNALSEKSQLGSFVGDSLMLNENLLNALCKFRGAVQRAASEHTRDQLDESLFTCFAERGDRIVNRMYRLYGENGALLWAVHYNNVVRSPVITKNPIAGRIYTPHDNVFAMATEVGILKTASPETIASSYENFTNSGAPREWNRPTQLELGFDMVPRVLENMTKADAQFMIPIGDTNAHAAVWAFMLKKGQSVGGVIVDELSLTWTTPSRIEQFAHGGGWNIVRADATLPAPFAAALSETRYVNRAFLVFTSLYRTPAAELYATAIIRAWAPVVDMYTKYSVLP